MTDTVEPGVDVVIVAEPVGTETRYLAAVARNGRSTSLDCTHLHHTPAAARRCIRATWARLAEWEGATETEVAPGLWELAIPGVTLRWRHTDLEITH